MKIHNYDNNGIYTTSNEATPDPIDGQPLIPANATDVAPPALAAGECAQWDGSAWQIITDLRGQPVWDTATGEQITCDQPGSLPAGYTDQPRPDALHSWDATAGAWVPDPALQREHALQAARDAYAQAMATPVQYAGAQFQADEQSATRLANVIAAVGAGWALPKNFAWIDASNQPHAADLPWLQGLAQAIADHQAQAFAALQAAKQAA